MLPLGLVSIGSITDRILSLPVGLVFLLPAQEASAFLGFIFPGEIAVILGGVVASQGRAPPWAFIVAAASGAIIGDSIGYFIGRRWGGTLAIGTSRILAARSGSGWSPIVSAAAWTAIALSKKP